MGSSRLVNQNPTLQVRVPKWIAEAVTELANEQEVSAAEVCRQAIHLYLNQRAVVAPGMAPINPQDR